MAEARGISTKVRIQTFLRRLGLYHRVKMSRLYDLYWRLADRRVVDGLLAELAFYRKHLRGFRRGDLIFDIGANEGHKTNVFLRMGAHVVAVDPDEHNQEVLRLNFLTLRIFKRPVEIVGKAVSDTNGTATFWIDAPGSAKNTLNRKWVDILRTDDSRFGARLGFSYRREVETVSLDSLMATHGIPFFIKIDVEGHEPSILRGLRRPVPYLSFETNLPEFRSEGEECIEILGRLDPNGRFNYTIDCRGDFRLPEWVDKRGFLSTFNSCLDPSIEVFWQAGSTSRGR